MLGGRPFRGAARRPAAVRAVRPRGDGHARRADAGRTAAGLPGGQLVAGGRRQGYLGAGKPAGGPRERGRLMLCRVADDIFWMSRYVERAIAVGRLIDVTWHLELDAGDPYGATDFWATLLGPDRQALAATGELRPRDVRRYLAFDRDNPNS